MSLATAPLNLVKANNYTIDTPTKTSEGHANIVSMTTTSLQSAREMVTRAATTTTLHGGIGFLPSSRNYARATAARVSTNINRNAGQRSTISPVIIREATTKGVAGASIYQQQGSSAASFGNFLGTATQAMGMLNQMGINFNSKSEKAQGPKGRGNDVENAVNNAFGSSGNGANIDALSATGVPSASSFGANFESKYSSIMQSLNDKNVNPNSLSNAIEALNTSAAQDLYSAKGLEGMYAQMEADTVNVVNDLQNTKIPDAKKAVNSAKTEFGERQGALKQQTVLRNKADDALSQSDANYKEKCDALIGAESKKTEAQASVSTAKTNLATAKAKVSTTTAQLSAAESQLQLARSANPVNQVAVLAAEKAVDAARQAKNDAELARQEAEGKLTDANTDLDKANEGVNTAKSNKQTALDKYKDAEGNYKGAAKACADAQKMVDDTQQKYDAALENKDNCEANLKEVETQLDDYNSAKNQHAQIKEKLSTLEKNVNKASSLQDKTEKAIEKYNKDHSDSAS